VWKKKKTKGGEYRSSLPTKEERDMEPKIAGDCYGNRHVPSSLAGREKEILPTPRTLIERVKPDGENGGKKLGLLYSLIM